MINDRLGSLFEQAEILADMLKNSKEYIEYSEAKARLEMDADNIKALKELREQEVGIHFAKIIGDDVDKKKSFINEMYMAVSLNPVISDYLNAEYRLGKIMKELNRIFGDILVLGQDEELELMSGLNAAPEQVDYIN